MYYNVIIFNLKDIFILQVHKYMENKACAFQSVDKIRAYLMKLKNMPMNLTKKEKLLLINDPPDSVLQLSLVFIYFTLK